MNRKQFLVFSSSLIVPALFAGPPARAAPLPHTTQPAPVHAIPIRLRIGPAGSIERSTDDGQTWLQPRAFGPGVSVRVLSQADGVWQARLAFQNDEFWLHSTDGRKWFTPGWRRGQRAPHSQRG